MEVARSLGVDSEGKLRIAVAPGYCSEVLSDAVWHGPRATDPPLIQSFFSFEAGDNDETIVVCELFNDAAPADILGELVFQLKHYGQARSCAC